MIAARPLICLLALALLPGCERSSGGGRATAGSTTASTTSAAPAAAPAPVAGTTLLMDYTLAGGFYAAPFPDESRRRADGTVDLDAFPNPRGNGTVAAILDVLRRDARGFGTTSAIYFAASAPIAQGRLPALADTLAPGSPLFLIGVDPTAPDYLRRYPVEAAFHPDAGPYGAPNLLALLPLQGAPLREETRYAAVVLRALADAQGAPLGVSQSMAELAVGLRPAGMSSAAFVEHQAALTALRAAGVDPSDVAGLAVFRTDAPTAGFERARRALLARPLPRPAAPPTLVESYPDYCVYRTTIEMPAFQAGAPPFLSGGGGWVLDATGAPVLQAAETANLFVTVPRAPMPPQGWPTAVVIRTGLGQGEKPLVERGRHPAVGAPAAPGSGPALELAREGWVGVSVDGPHGGLRNVTGGDEQLLMFNVLNPVAMRDNVRQSALELVVLAEVLTTLSFPADPACGGGTVRLDPARFALFGHSMGATIAPLVLANQPRFRGAILSGAGGSWIENVVHKQKPVPVRPIADAMFGYTFLHRTLHEHDPALNLLQWAGEPADPPVYARYVTHEPRLGDPRHVLVLQGIVDNYILPPIANALTLALGLDLAGMARDAYHPLLSHLTPLHELLPLVGGSHLNLPVTGNRLFAGQPTTAVVVQHLEDGLEDGHEVAFQLEATKLQYRRFLRELARTGLPTVPR